MNRKCQKCYKEIAIGSRFCPFCGNEIADKPRFNNHALLWAVVILLLVILIPGIGIVFDKDKTGKGTDRTVHAVTPVEEAPVVPERVADSYEVYDTYKDTRDPYLNIRSGPGTTYPIIYKLSDGQRVEILERNLGQKGKWVKVYFSQGSTTGYVHSRYLRKVIQN